MHSKLRVLLNNNLDHFTSTLYRDTGCQEICIKTILNTTDKLLKQKKHWQNEALFVASFKAKMYVELLDLIKNNPSIKEKISSKISAFPLNLADLQHEIKTSTYPRKEIAKLYFIDQKGPLSVAQNLDISIDKVKHHLKVLKKRMSKI